MPTREELIAQAEKAGVRVDRRWSDARLIEAMRQVGLKVDDTVDYSNAPEAANAEREEEERKRAEAALIQKRDAGFAAEAEKKAAVEKAAPKVQTAPILLKKDVWGVDDARFKAGETVDWPVEDAKRLIKAGVAERADPMPGDA